MTLVRLSLALFVGIAFACTASAQKTYLFGTNPQGTLYYATGAAIVKVLTQSTDIKSTVQPTGGSSTYIPMINRKEMDFGFANVGESNWSYSGTKTFNGRPNPNIRLVAITYTLYNTLSVANDSPYRTVMDLKGKRMPSKYTAQNIFQVLQDAALANGGLNTKDMKAIPTSTSVGGLKMLGQGKTDVGIHGCGAGITKQVHAMLVRKGGLRHVPLSQSPEAIARMRKVFPGVGVCWVKPRKNWPGVRKPMGVMCYPAFMIVGAHVSDDVVYKVTKTMHDNPKALGDGFAALRGFKPKRMNLAHPTPYHAGAVKYYKEIGQWPPPTVK